MDTIAQLLQQGADAATAIGAPEAVPPLSYRELRALAQRTVAELNSLGIGRNHRVAMVLPNGPEAAAVSRSSLDSSKTARSQVSST